MMFPKASLALTASLLLPVLVTAQEGKATKLVAPAAKAEKQDPKKTEQKPERPPAPAFKMWNPRRPKDEASHKVAKWGPRGLPSPGYAFFAQKILPISAAPIFDGVVITRNGKIEAIGKASEISVPSG
ncbi:MAG: hypothetical protein ACI91B_003405, partial [Planctomycetota bacterium]